MLPQGKMLVLGIFGLVRVSTATAQSYFFK